MTNKPLTSLENLKIKSVIGRGIPIHGNDIDTDQIFPAKFMRCTTFDTIAQYLFYDARFNGDGSKKEHPLNEEKYKEGKIFIVNRNFGCGSSREHAPQAIYRYGIRAIIGESFAEIFRDNCTSIGMPAVTATKEEIEKLMDCTQKNPDCEIKIDLESKKVSCAQLKIELQLPEHFRKALVDGTWDSTAGLLSAVNQIQETAKKLPYMKDYR